MPETNTIAELFARDPYTLTKLEIDQIIEYYRERRLQFKMSGKAQPAAAKPQSSLEDLGL